MVSDLIKFYIEHIDNSGSNEITSKRLISGVAFLNKEYEGGKLSFFDGVYTPNVDQGSIVLFPSNFLFPHSVSRVVSGIRYTIVTWFWRSE